MIPTREKQDSLVLSRTKFEMVLRCYGIPCFYFNFFAQYLQRERTRTIRTTSMTVMIIFRKCHSGSYLVTACLKFVFNNYEPHRQQCFERHFLKILQIQINIYANSLWGNYHETNIDESARKVAQKSESALRRIFHQ